MKPLQLLEALGLRTLMHGGAFDQWERPLAGTLGHPRCIAELMRAAGLLACGATAAHAPGTDNGSLTLELHHRFSPHHR